MQSGVYPREEVPATAFVVQVSHSEQEPLRPINWIVHVIGTRRLTHIPGIRSRAVHRFGSELPIPTKDLRHHCILRSNEAYKQRDEGTLTCLQVGERDTIRGVVCLGKEEVPEAEFAGFYLELLKNRDLRPPAKLRIGWKLSCSNLEGGFNLLLRRVDVLN